MKNIACIFILFLLPAASHLSAQSCIVMGNCPTAPVSNCDLTANDTTLWNEPYWLDNATGLHDMADAPADLSLSVTDTCPGGILDIRYILFLDLDNNGTRETAIKSWALPPDGSVYYDNFDGVNFNAGVLRAFDERPVPSYQKFRFAIEQTGSGTDKIARLRWSNQANPGNFVLPQLPYGTHKIKWLITDALSNADSCEYLIEVEDCDEPTLVCINNITVNLQSDGQFPIWATDLLQYAEDNHTPAGLLEFAVRKYGIGSGFPLNSGGAPQDHVTFTCVDVGTRLIELWGLDLSGNTAYCVLTVKIEDNMDFCVPGLFDLQLCVKSYCNDAVLGGLTYNQGIPDSFDPQNGCAYFEDPVIGSDPGFMIPANNTDPLNGVNTLDIIKISRHILGLESLASPYAMYAADVNKSNTITTFDILEEKKLIQGLYTNYPNNTSWQFFDANLTFTNPNNPFQGPFLNGLSYTLQDSVLIYDFVGVKIGDVDCSATPGFANPATEVRFSSRLSLPEALLQPGETVDIPVSPVEASAWLGMQLGLRFDPAVIALESVIPGRWKGMDETSFAMLQPGQLNMVWFNPEPLTVLPGDELFTLRLKALTPVKLSEAIYIAREKFSSEAYTAEEATQKLQLTFAERSDTPVEAGIFKPQPNPTSEGATIPMRLDRPETVTLEISDVSGKRLWVNQLTLDPGAHLLDVPAAALPRAGVYIWSLKAGALTSSGKLVKL